MKYLILLFLLGFTAIFVLGQTDTSKKVYTSKSENAICFKCHGNRVYEVFNSDSSKVFRDRMCCNLIIDSVQYYTSNHFDFKCTDCHSSEFKILPHPGKLKFEDKPNCIDCHGGDEKYKKYNFEEIQKEFEKSVHSSKHNNDFSCWSCHNPHSYKINARNKQEIKNTIAYDNAICLSCHANIDKYQIILEKENPNILVKHEWLPNQAAHFKSVRCIECHALQDDSILVSHNIKVKSKAVKKCVECHSANSILKQSLYKYNTQENRKLGFFNSNILRSTFVIGANKNYYLNIGSVCIFSLVLLVITIHIILRIKLRQ